MSDKGLMEKEEIFSKVLRAGRRTYFFDVRSTKAGDYFMTLAESVRDFNKDGVPSYKKHKLYLYKEDFKNFKEAFEEVSSYIIQEKGEEIISDKKYIVPKKDNPTEGIEKSSTDFTEVSFEDLGED